MKLFRRLFVVCFCLLLIFSASADAGTSTYTYDALGRLSSTTYSTGEVVNYTYDAAGNRTAHTVTGSIYNSDPNAAKLFVVVPISGFTIIQINNPNCGLNGCF